MSDQLLFDNLAYIDRLKRAGIAEDHARAHAEGMEEALRESVATKSDLLAVKTALHGDMVALRDDMQGDMVAVRADLQMLRTDMVALEHRLTMLAGVMAAAVVAVLASIKFFG